VVFVVQASGEDAADSLAKEMLPRFVGMATLQCDLKPTEMVVEGQRLYTLGEAPLCYGRHGATLVLGFDTELVAGALNGGAKKRGLLADEKVRADLARLADPVAVALVKPIALGGFFMVARTEYVDRAEYTEPKPKGLAPGEGGSQQILAQLEKDEPLTIALTRKPDQLQIEARYPGLRTMVPLLTNLLILQKVQSAPPAVPYKKVTPVPPPKPKAPSPPSEP
jgi:hypothetical protein